MGRSLLLTLDFIWASVIVHISAYLRTTILLVVI